MVFECKQYKRTLQHAQWVIRICDYAINVLNRSHRLRVSVCLFSVNARELNYANYKLMLLLPNHVPHNTHVQHRNRSQLNSTIVRACVVFVSCIYIILQQNNAYKATFSQAHRMQGFRVVWDAIRIIVLNIRSCEYCVTYVLETIFFCVWSLCDRAVYGYNSTFIIACMQFEIDRCIPSLVHAYSTRMLYNYNWWNILMIATCSKGHGFVRL